MKKILGASDAWSTSCLSHRLSEEAYHIVDFWILIHYLSPSTVSNTRPWYMIWSQMVNLLVEWEPNFKQTKQKLNYSEIWSLAISPEQKVITARDNNCMIYDMGKWKDFPPWLMPYPCSHFYFDIKFGDRLYSKENRPGSPLLFWI